MHLMKTDLTAFGVLVISVLSLGLTWFLFGRKEIKVPEAGVVLEGTGGLRKLRYADPHRSRGKRSGLRVIYYWCDAERQFWLFRLYVKVDVDEDTVGRRIVSGKQLARALGKAGRSLEATTRQSRKRSSHYRAPKHSVKVDLD